MSVRLWTFSRYTGGISGKRSKLQASPFQFGCNFAPPLSTPSMRTLRVGLAVSTRIPNRSETHQPEYWPACVHHRMSALCLVPAFLEPAALPHHVQVATTTRHPVSVVISTGQLGSTHWECIEPSTCSFQAAATNPACRSDAAC